VLPVFLTLQASTVGALVLVRHHRQSTSVLKAPPLVFVQKLMFVNIPDMYLTFSVRYCVYLLSCVNETYFTNIFLVRPHAT
jgi:hypothetical protein